MRRLAAQWHPYPVICPKQTHYTLTNVNLFLGKDPGIEVNCVEDN
jgi:hypothetical protein